LAAPYALFLLLDRDARRALKTSGPWLGIVVALIIASPHLVWLVENDFLPFRYVEMRAAPVHGWFDHILHPAFFAGGQLFFMLPTLFIAAMFVWPRATPPPPYPPPQAAEEYQHIPPSLAGRVGRGPALTGTPGRGGEP
jgi:4-amino-4-deoxy-L-arabinose transferase-like glycosyltransferase